MKKISDAIALFALLSARAVLGADSVWTGSESTDWSDVRNWANGHVPASNDTDGYVSPTFNKTDATRYTVDFGSTQYTIKYPVLKSGIDAAHTYTFTATGEGGLTSTDAFDIGRDPGSKLGGAIIFDGGSYTFHTMNLGWYYGYGYLTLNSGTTLNIPGDICLGIDPGEDASRAFAYGEMNINGGTLNHTADEFKVGHSYNSTSLVGGRGVVKQTAGTVNTRYLAIPKDSYCYGRYELSGGTVKSELEIEVGKADFGKGELIISGGYMELGSGKEFHVCGNGHSNTGLVYVTGGALVNKDNWFCVGRSAEEENNASYAYLEINGGAVSNIADSCNFTIGTLGTDDCHSEVKVKSGELYTKKILYVGEIHPAKMTVTGGRIYANESVCVQGSDSTLIVKGGVIETDHIYKGSNGKLDIRGGTFKAIAATDNYFNNCGDLVVSHNGLAMDTAGFNVMIGNNISGLGGITKKGAGTLTLSGTVSVTGAIVVEEGSLVIDGTTYGVGTAREATYTPAVPETAIWTNALEDGDQADPANWTCYDASGNVIESGAPTGATAVTIPYSLAVNPVSVSPYQTFYPSFAEFTGYASVVLGISGTAAPRGDCAAPAVVNTAIAWYDFDDATTVTVGGNDLITGVANKGTGGDTLDGTIHDANSKRPVYKVAQSLGERNMMHLTNSFGIVSASAAGISGDADRTIVAVTKRVTNTYRNNDDSGYENQMFPVGIESEMWDANSGAFRIEEQETSCLVAHGNGAAYVDTNNDSHSAPNNAFNMTMPSSPDEWLVWTAESASKEISASWYGVASGLNVATNATVSGGLGTAESAKIYVGMRLLWNSGSVGELGEAMVFDKALSEEELADVRSYLATKWLKTPEVPLDTLPSSVAFSGEDAVYNLGGGDWTLDSITGAGTISNANVTVAGTITVTVKDDGTIDPLVIDGSLTLGEGAKLVVKNAKKLSAGTALDAITATGGISGAFASVETEPAEVSMRARVGTNIVTIMRRNGFVIVIQ